MKIKEYFKNEIFIGSLIVISLTFFGNLFSYLFQFVSARLLGPSDYVIVAVITSMIAIFGIPSLAIQTVIAKNTTAQKMKNNMPKIKGLMMSSLKSMFLLSVVFFVFYSLVAIILYRLLNIPYIYLFLTGFYIFGAFLYPIMAGIAQGLKKFSDFGFNFLINCFVKFIVGATLMYLGFGVYGALTGFLAGIFIAFIFFFYNLKKIVKIKGKKYSVNIFSKDNKYPLFSMIIFVLLFNLDVIFAKALFSSDIAGIYSVASLLGKIILFIVSSIGTVMLPLSSEKYISGKDSKNVIHKTLLLASIVCFFGTVAFFLFPKLIVSLLFGEQYLAVSSILVYVGLAFSFLSFLNIYLLQIIATDKNNLKSVGILLICLIIECSVFQLSSTSIEKFSIGFMISAFISAIGGYALYKYGKN